ncbi:MAG TPA: alpha/beta hydrolase [Conexibacter sp.]
MDPDVRALMDGLAAGFPALGESVLDAAQARRMLAELPAPELEPLPVGRVEQRMVDGAEGEIPARVYWPHGVDGSSDEPLPLVVFFHGGGWVLCDLDSHDAACRNLASLAEVVVVSVDYRLAPEAPHPAGVEDAYAATCWAHAHAAELGGDPDRLVVAGDSSGGHFAAVVALMARDRSGPPIAYQLLIYPVTQHDFETASYVENGEGYFTTRRHMRWYWEQYLSGGADVEDPYVSPLRADLADLPPAHVITAELDPLRDEGEEYARRLREAGVPTTARRYDGMFHGFFTFPQLLEAAQRANEREFGVLRSQLRALNESDVRS